jgi:phospholipid/cholesterol/gamma-HCH transport system ATP-binding protein
MRDATPVLELTAAEPDPEQSTLLSSTFTLRLMPSDCVLVESRDPARAREFADLCCGLLPLSSGHASFLGYEWASLSDDDAAALRSRIGWIFSRGAWIEFLGTDLNILLPRLHNTRRSPIALREAAADLSRSFGLPGLPLVRPEALTAIDLARAACVRAFLGEPRLLILESPVQGQFADLVSPLLNALAAARDRGAAAIWLTRSDFVWTDRSFPATARLRLAERGLTLPRQAA